MCAPIVLGLISTAVSGISAGIEASNASAQANYQAKLFDYNEKVAENRAVEARSAAGNEATRTRTNASREIARNRALFAARGLDVGGSGTVGNLLDESRLFSEVEAGAVKTRGQAAAGDYLVDALNYRAQATATRASIGPTVASSALNATGSVANTWYRIGAEEGW